MVIMEITTKNRLISCGINFAIPVTAGIFFSVPIPKASVGRAQPQVDVHAMTSSPR
jgi:hypothetical protein